MLTLPRSLSLTSYLYTQQASTVVHLAGGGKALVHGGE